jgi:hypothetical protein
MRFMHVADVRLGYQQCSSKERFLEQFVARVNKVEESDLEWRNELRERMLCERYASFYTRGGGRYD